MAEVGGFDKELVNKTHDYLFKTLLISDKESMLALDQGTLLLLHKQGDITLGLALRFQTVLRKSMTESTAERSPKRAKTGPQKANAMTKEELADKIIQKFSKPALLNEALPNGKEDFTVVSLNCVHCNICNTPITLHYEASPSHFYRHLIGDKPGVLTDHLKAVNNRTSNKASTQRMASCAELLRSKLSELENQDLCYCGIVSIEKTLSGVTYLVCARRYETDPPLAYCKYKVPKAVTDGYQSYLVRLHKKSRFCASESDSFLQHSAASKISSYTIEVLKDDIKLMRAQYSALLESCDPSIKKELGAKELSLRLVDRLLTENTPIDSKTWDLVDRVLNFFRGKNGKRYHYSSVEIAKKLKMRGGSACLALVSTASKATICRSKAQHLTEYGVSEHLIRLAKQYYKRNNILDANFIICLDGIYVPKDDNICLSSRTRHGFIVPDNNSVLDIESYAAVEKPFVEQWEYARQVIAVLLCPLVPGYNSFPIGLVPVASAYDAVLTRSLFNKAIQVATNHNFNIFAQSADNASGHALYFKEEVEGKPFVIKDWPIGSPSDRPAPFVDYMHVGRKLCNQIINPKRVIMIGEMPIVIQPLYALEHEIQGFNVRIMKHQDPQYQQRVTFLLGNEELHKRLEQVESACSLAVYLKMMQRFYFAFASKTWTWAQRVFAGWQAVCFLVYTRRFIQESAYSLGTNHMTLPTYNAVLLSVTSLITCCQKWNSAIAPWLLCEYWCELFFSSVRSWIVNKSSVTVTEIWHIMNEIIDSRLMEAPGQKCVQEEPPKDRLSPADLVAILAGADNEVRDALQAPQFGMQGFFLKYHDVTSCLHGIAGILKQVLPEDEILIPKNLNLPSIKKSMTKTRHILLSLSPSDQERFKGRFKEDCGNLIPVSTLLNLFGTYKRQHQKFSRDRERRPMCNEATSPTFSTDDDMVTIDKDYIFVNVKDEDPTIYCGKISQITALAQLILSVVPKAPISAVKNLIVNAELWEAKSSSKYPIKQFVITELDHWQITEFSKFINPAAIN